MSVTAEKRQIIFERQNWRCCYCGFRMYAPAKESKAQFLSAYGGSCQPTRNGRKRFLRSARATIEHLHRLADGGKNTIDNLVGACGWCNSSRQEIPADSYFEEIKWLKMEGNHPLFPQPNFAHRPA